MKRSLLDGLENKKIIKDLECEFSKISTDTRTISRGDFYIPLKGANFDGELFIESAVDSGAIGFLTTKEAIADKYLTDERVRFIAIVPDTKIAYMELAGAYLKVKKMKVVGITGSSGKTTTKEMVFAVLSEAFKTHKTVLNHNNEIGFCQTVFETPEDSEVVIIEMGMRGLGEIELISKYANPDVAIITNVGTAHIGRLGSRENIAKAKCEIAEFLKSTGIFIANDDILIKNTVDFGGEKKYYSISDVAVVESRIGCSRFIYEGYEYELPIEGNHNIENALAAINTGKFLGMSRENIALGLKAFRTIENRWNVEKVGSFELINDCYNANPESMMATIDTVLGLYVNPVLVLGNMGELGEESLKYHEKIGDFINNHSKLSKNSVIITVGDLAKGISNKVTNALALNFENNSGVADYILKNDNIVNILFFKASRSMKFEEIINKIKGDI